MALPDDGFVLASSLKLPCGRPHCNSSRDELQREGWRSSSGGFEETRLAVWKLDSQSRFSTFCNVRRFDFAALYTLQHGLTGDAESAGGPLHGDEALTRRGGEACFQRVSHPDSPRRAGGDLLAGDQAVVQPTMQGRGRNVQDDRRRRDRHDVSFRSLQLVLETGDAPMGP